MSATEKRVDELLERWLASVERHARYLQLDDAAYARAEAWPKHQRPNALVVNLARTRLLELKSHLTERRDAGDTRFAESLELMAFLTSLLGSEHLQRFIPLATGKPADSGISATIEQPRIRAPAKSTAQQRGNGERQSNAASTTHANVAAVKSASGSHRRPARAPAKTSTPAHASAPAPARAPAVAPRSAATSRPPPPTAIGDAMVEQVLADASRMLQWGREWPAIAGLIARMADRPSEAEVWKILRAHRSRLLDKGPRTTG